MLAQAAVVGRTFWEGALERLQRPELGGAPGGAPEAAPAELLTRLRHRQLIRPREPAMFPGEREYVFAESAMYEVAYEMLSVKVRRPLHLVIARWLEERASGSAGNALLALHYDRGGDARRAAAAYARGGGARGVAGGERGGAAAAGEGATCTTRCWRRAAREAAGRVRGAGGEETREEGEEGGSPGGRACGCGSTSAMCCGGSGGWTRRSARTRRRGRGSRGRPAGAGGGPGEQVELADAAVRGARGSPARARAQGAGGDEGGAAARRARDRVREGGWGDGGDAGNVRAARVPAPARAPPTPESWKAAREGLRVCRKIERHDERWQENVTQLLLAWRRRCSGAAEWWAPSGATGRRRG